ncbi:ef hand family protein [Stylonychia lemnae]|uniref:Ef hand family protein n=1 Tax=Stylonychia lemnae TaxID=5949 RepID=A0A077ZS73_STYLE|nr:ef hand family protein [Stylonychia lemnae]|eukprot:CDW72748.1 ef hand family protein [Stylonychia lemnae]
MYLRLFILFASLSTITCLECPDLTCAFNFFDGTCFIHSGDSPVSKIEFYSCQSNQRCNINDGNYAWYDTQKQDHSSGLPSLSAMPNKYTTAYCVKTAIAEANNKVNLVLLMRTVMQSLFAKLFQNGLIKRLANHMVFMVIHVQEISTATQRISAGISSLRILQDAIYNGQFCKSGWAKNSDGGTTAQCVDLTVISSDIYSNQTSPYQCTASLSNNYCKYYYDGSTTEYFQGLCECSLDNSTGYCPRPGQWETDQYIKYFKIVNQNSRCHTLDRNSMEAQLECGIGDSENFKQAVNWKLKFERWNNTASRKASQFGKKYSILLSNDENVTDGTHRNSQQFTDLQAFRRSDSQAQKIIEEEVPTPINNPISERTLKSSETIRWLKIRYQNSAKTESLQTMNEVKRNKDIQQIFKRFDEDQSGLLELDEINQLFLTNGIKLGKNNTKEFFKLLDADNSGSLSVQEFKEFLFNDKCKDQFRNIMRNVRKDLQNEIVKAKTADDLIDCTYGQYLPFAFEDMLQHLHKLSKRKQILDQISDPIKVNQKEIARKDMNNFLRLFKEYQGRIEDGGNSQPNYLKLRLRRGIKNPFSPKLKKQLTTRQSKFSSQNLNNQGFIQPFKIMDNFKSPKEIVITEKEEDQNLHTVSSSSTPFSPPQIENFTLSSGFFFKNHQINREAIREKQEERAKEENYKEKLQAMFPQKQIEDIVNQAQERGKLKAKKLISKLSMAVTQNKSDMELSKKIHHIPSISVGKIRINPSTAFASARNSITNQNDLMSPFNQMPSAQEYEFNGQSLNFDLNIMPQLVKQNQPKRARKIKIFSLTNQNSNEKMNNQLEDFRYFQEGLLQSERLNSISNNIDNILGEKLKILKKGNKTIADLLQLNIKSNRNLGEHSLNARDKQTPQQQSLFHEQRPSIFTDRISPKIKSRVHYKRLMMQDLSKSLDKWSMLDEKIQYNKSLRMIEGNQQQKQSIQKQNPPIKLINLKAQGQFQQEIPRERYVQRIPMTNLRINQRYGLILE